MYTFVAHLADVCLVPGVFLLDVLDHVPVLGEAEVTEAADVRPQPLVDPHVVGQVVLVLETLVTNIALKHPGGLVGQLVPVEGGLLPEPLPTQVAHVRLAAAVDQSVTLELVVGGEISATLWALVLLVTLVGCELLLIPGRLLADVTEQIRMNLLLMTPQLWSAELLIPVFTTVHFTFVAPGFDGTQITVQETTEVFLRKAIISIVLLLLLSYD